MLPSGHGLHKPATSIRSCSPSEETQESPCSAKKLEVAIDDLQARRGPCAQVFAPCLDSPRLPFSPSPSIRPLVLLPFSHPIPRLPYGRRGSGPRKARPAQHQRRRVAPLSGSVGQQHRAWWSHRPSPFFNAELASGRKKRRLDDDQPPRTLYRLGSTRVSSTVVDSGNRVGATRASRPDKGRSRGKSRC